MSSPPPQLKEAQSGGLASETTTMLVPSNTYLVVTTSSTSDIHHHPVKSTLPGVQLLSPYQLESEPLSPVYTKQTWSGLIFHCIPPKNYSHHLKRNIRILINYCGWNSRSWENSTGIILITSSCLTFLSFAPLQTSRKQKSLNSTARVPLFPDFNPSFDRTGWQQTFPLF